MRATWPYTARWTSAQPRMVGEVQAPQLSISGVETIVRGLGARWEVTGSFVIHGEEQELAWQAFIAQMEGGAGTTLVPIWSRYRPRDNRGREAPWDRMAGVADAQAWEHFGFETGPVGLMQLAAPAPLRATTIRVSAVNSTGIRPGQYFSLGERLHRVQQHWQDAGGTSNLMIQPPLRQAFTAAALILDRPVCLMRLAEPAGDMEYTPEGVGRVTCRFVEAV